MYFLLAMTLSLVTVGGDVQQMELALPFETKAECVAHAEGVVDETIAQKSNYLANFGGDYIIITQRCEAIQ